MSGRAAAGGAATATATDAVASVERELTLLLRRSRALSDELARQVHPDLEASSYSLLASIRDLQPVQASQLAALYSVDKSAISRQLARLETIGLVERGTDADDARARPLVLTARGRERLARASDGRRAQFHAAFEDWPQDDVVALAELLHRYNTSFTAQQG